MQAACQRAAGVRTSGSPKLRRHFERTWQAASWARVKTSAHKHTSQAMRVIEPVEDAPLRICVGPALTTPAQVAQLSSLLRAAAARQQREDKKARKPTKSARPSQENSLAVQTLCCGPHREVILDTEDQEDARWNTFRNPCPLASTAVGRAVKVKLDDGKWYAHPVEQPLLRNRLM